jgi:hypothetical protein
MVAFLATFATIITESLIQIFWFCNIIKKLGPKILGPFLFYIYKCFL